MTVKQCNSCKWHTYEKRGKNRHEGCFLVWNSFMGSKNCESYSQGDLNKGKKDFYKELGRAPYEFLNR